MISNHFYSRYGLALLMQEYNISNIQDITSEMLINLIQNGRNHFRLKPGSENNETIDYQFANESFLRKNIKYINSHCNEGYFLSPNIISSNIAAKNNWRAMNHLIESLQKKNHFKSTEKATMSIMPLTSKFNKGRMSQSSPNITLIEACLCMITTTTPYKPALNVDGNVSTAIIPDLELNELIKFISILKIIQRTQTANLMRGKIERKDDKPIYHRPKLSNGNFPYAPRRTELASAALLGAIGWFANQVEYPNTGADILLEKLKQNPLYIISYGNAKSVRYNHYVVDLAKNNKLRVVIDAFERIIVYKSDEKNQKNYYQKKDALFLFASRFLQLFDPQSFRDFISIRGEYPQELIQLFNIYIRNIMKIEPNIIDSAISLGHWLNNIAFFAAKDEIKGKGAKNNNAEIRKQKAKIIVELESAVFSSKKASDLVSHVITRAGRISSQDAPYEAQSFIKAVLACELGETEKESLENAKNMIVVFSRIRGSNNETIPEPDLDEQSEENEEIQLTEDEQE
jgi:hypothetical protein